MNQEKLALVKELHKPARRNYLRRKFDIRGIDETWQADLVEMTTYAKENKGYKYILTVIDIFSKFAWAVPVKTKTGEDVTAAMKSVLDQGRVPKNLHVDQGKEFYNTHFKNLMKQYKINMYSTFSNLKAAICERFNRTLKNKMWMQFSLHGYTPNWTTEIFTIDIVNNTEPTTYLLKDYQNNPVAGNFYQQELAPANNPDIYLVEKVIKKRGNKIYVKWLGFDNSHNSWIENM
ncbi:uncharacterized protein LOC127289561 [Leptopilina boulardi]|uniref:uncharacterized protein LOC127278638 n=1 Tax=Leptopilina boulardi TaxID=63433 RepID=UPI0021F6575F|nr:uncharacterized protein LOC127278638 [Leptopilina boulardi]XP_051173508.1 uncharacterized protein LOC127289561 [Leptopilina boulardi]